MCAITLLLLLSFPAGSINAESQVDNGSLNIPSLNKAYNIVIRNWFFKAEDDLSYKEISVDTSNWKLGLPHLPIDMLSRESKEYYGNAWFRLNIHINELDKEKKYAIMLPYTKGGLQVYINGRFITENREFSADGKTPHAGGKPKLVEIPAGYFNQGANVLAIRVSRVDDWGGFAGNSYIGPLDDLHLKWVRFILRYTFISFICIFLAFFYFVHYLQRKKEVYYLWFAGLNLSIGIFLLGVTGLSLYLLDYYWVYALLTFLGGINIYFMILNFLHSFLNRKMGIIGKAFHFFYLSLSIILLIEYLFTGGILYFQKYIYMPFIFSYTFLFIYLLAVNIRAIREKAPYALHIFWGVAILAVGLVYGMAVFSGIIQADPMVGEGYLAMIIAFAVVVAARFSHTHGELEKAHENLQIVDRLKDDFLANTSHELRTPLLGIIGIAETLMDGATGELSQKTKENLSMIAYSGKRLSSLVNDIIDFSKLKNQDIELQLKSVDLKALVDVILTLSGPLLSGKSIELINDVSKEMPPVWADENRLQQILYNLVGNAIKFTNEGKIRVDAHVISSNGGEFATPNHRETEFVQVVVSDTGIGIEPDKFETIFQSFEQADASISREYGGTGLGLSITKHLIELHNGGIKVESEVGKGSQFIFILPVSDQNVDETGEDGISQNVIIGQQISKYSFAFDESRDDEKTAIQDHRGNLKNGRERQLTEGSLDNIHVLIVDDEPVNLQVLSNILSFQNCTISRAVNGTEALEIFENSAVKPDIILLDVMMPKMSGFEVCEKIRSKCPPNEVPVIMLTAKNQVSDLVSGLGSGANDYITKPYSKNELLARMSTQLSLVQATRAFGKLSAIEKELSVAKNIQEAALPASLPESQFWNIAATCIPMIEIGGDFYDFHQVDDKRLGIIAGDVSGHGIPAALTLSMLKIAFSLQLSNAGNPKEVLESINKILYGHCESNFITASYVFIDNEEKVLHYANAGHPPSYLWNAREQKLIPLSTKGIGLGLQPAPEYQLLSQKIEEGDRIIMYTDGFLEAMHKSGEMYEKERLIKAIRKNRDATASEAVNRLVEEINEWSAKQSDDLTLVVIDIA